jgi:intracellular septation protein A
MAPEMPNMAVDADVLSAGFGQPTARRSLLRYIRKVQANMKLGISLFWRVVVLQLVFTLVLLLLLKNSVLITDPSYMTVKPSIAAAAFAIFLLTLNLSLRNGPIFLLWGARLNKNHGFWKRFTFSLVGFYLLISLLNWAVAKLVSVEVWLQYKTFAPLVFLLLFMLTIPSRLEQYNSSLNSDGHLAAV